MNLFEKSQAYHKRVEAMQGTLDRVEKEIGKEDALAKKALADGDRDAFFEHSRKRAVAEKKRDEINEMPCNGSGCSAEEVEAAWNQHKESANYRKKLEALCSARNAYIQSIQEIRRAYKQEADEVKKFLELAATSGCSQEIMNEMKPPRMLRWDIIEKCVERGQFVCGVWQTEKVPTLTPDQLEQ